MFSKCFSDVTVVKCINEPDFTEWHSGWLSGLHTSSYHSYFHFCLPPLSLLPFLLSSLFLSLLFLFFLLFPQEPFVHLPIIYLLVPEPPVDIMQCVWGPQGLRGWCSLLDGPLTVITERAGISIAVFVWSEFSAVTLCPRYWICLPQCIPQTIWITIHIGILKRLWKLKQCGAK